MEGARSSRRHRRPARRSRTRSLHALPRSTGSRARSAAVMRKPACRFEASDHAHSSMNLAPSCEPRLSGFPRRVTWERPSPICSITGRVCASSSMTVASRWIRMPQKIASGHWRSRFHCTLHRQVSVNIGSVSPSAMRHGRFLRATAALITSEARSSARI